MDGDDSISIVLDTFGDRRTAFLFRINPAGARQDGLIDAAGAVTLDWDGIWDAAVARESTGWSAEITIPSRTLSFNPNRTNWGVNVERHVARDLLTLRWVGTTLDSKLTDLRRAGTLAGANAMKQGLGLSITPFTLASTQIQRNSATADADVGVDLTYSFTPQLSSVLTVNTDFAEAEVDERQINLTRFDLFFPEKRDFFLQGSNQFIFGEKLDDGGQLDSEFIPFFSRRVGLVEGEEVPIVAGYKMVGKEGKFGVGVLDVLTDETDTVPDANLFVGRFTYDAADKLQIGTIVTDGDPGVARDNTLLGLDATWRTSTLRGSKNFIANVWGTRSSGDIPEGQPSGWGVGIFYPNDLWDLEARVFEFGDALDPALGFLPRPGTRNYRAEVNWQPRPRAAWLDWMRQYFVEVRYFQVDDLDGNNESWLLWTAPVKFLTESGDEFELNYLPQGETLKEPFEVSEGVVIPPGEFDFERFRATLRTSAARAWNLMARVWFGDFFDGTLTTLETSAGLSVLKSRLNFAFEGENNWGNLPQGDFDRKLYRIRAGYDFNPDLRIASFIQYDSDSDVLGSNTRLRWIITPGRELFVIWNRGASSELESPTVGQRTTTSNEVSVKLSWTLRP